MTTFTTPRYALGIIAAATSLIFLSGCEKKDDGQTVGQKLDSAVSKAEQAGREAKKSTEETLNKAGNSAKNAVQKAEVSGSNTVQVMTTSVEDIAITARVSAGLAKDADLSAIKIDVDTKNGVVLLSGPAPSAAARDKATIIARSTKGVNSVDNKLVVKAN